MQIHDPLAAAEAVRHEWIELTERDAIAPADAVVLAIPQKVYVAEGWGCIVPLLKNGCGVVIDVKARLDRASKPDGVELWRLLKGGGGKGGGAGATHCRSSGVAIAALMLLQDRDHVRIHHVLDQLSKLVLCRQPSLLRALPGSPCRRRPRSAGNSAGRPRPAPSRSPCRCLSPSTPAAPDDRPADTGEGLLHEFAHRMAFSGRQHVVVRRVLLQDEPHAFDEIARMTPIALGIEIAEIDASCSPCLIEATARVILRVTNVSPRIGLS